MGGVRFTLGSRAGDFTLHPAWGRGPGISPFTILHPGVAGRGFHPSPWGSRAGDFTLHPGVAGRGFHPSPWGRGPGISLFTLGSRAGDFTLHPGVAGRGFHPSPWGRGLGISPFTLGSRAGDFTLHAGVAGRVLAFRGAFESAQEAQNPKGPKAPTSIEKQTTCSLSSVWRVLTAASCSVTPSLDGTLGLHETCFGPHRGRRHCRQH